MDCRDVKNLLAEFVDGELSAGDRSLVEGHLTSCSVCRAEAKQMRQAWDILKTAPEIEPQPGYMSRFWSEVANRKPWHERISEYLRNALRSLVLVPVRAGAFALLIVGILAVVHSTRLAGIDHRLARLNPDEAEALEHMELAQHFETIANIELLENLDIIQNLECLQSPETVI